MSSSTDLTRPGLSSEEMEFRDASPIEPEARAHPGQRWCVNKEGDLWPVVICDEDCVKKFFVQEKARVCLEQGFYPALYPGTLKL